MDRLLVLRIEALGCVAEAWLNGVALGRVGPARQVLSLPVHEYAMAGANELALHINPGPMGQPAAPAPTLSDGQTGASLRLLLPRHGTLAEPGSARTLAQIEWAPAAQTLYETPLLMSERADLPLQFPRWRWLDVPSHAPSPELQKLAAGYLQGLALHLCRGEFEPFVQACRLKLEELALAYQRDVAQEAARLLQHLQALHAQQALAPPLPKETELLLRPLADGRLLECLRPDGSPSLQSPRADGSLCVWPLRLALIEGHFYVLR